MPRKRKPARLYCRPDTAEWIIRDGSRSMRTGRFGPEGANDAEEALSRYIADRAQETPPPSKTDAISVGKVLILYLAAREADAADPKRIAYAIKALSPFWADLPVSAVRGETCRRYVRERGAAESTARRELGTLQAALNHAHAEGVLLHPVKVSLPRKAPPRDRWLTRDEVAKLLRHSSPGLRRFLLIAAYTGTRVEAVLALRWLPSLDSGWVDLERGILHRRGNAERETKKRRGSCRLTRRLLSHMRRWQGGEKVVPYETRSAVRKALARAAEKAGVEDIRPHDLKRTAVTWAFQKGMSLEDAADYFSTDAKTLERVYRQHSPLYQGRAVAILDRRR